MQFYHLLRFKHKFFFDNPQIHLLYILLKMTSLGLDNGLTVMQGAGAGGHDEGLGHPLPGGTD